MSEIKEVFVRDETFVDCAGVTRKFMIVQTHLYKNEGVLLTAREYAEDSAGYEIQFWAPFFDQCSKGLFDKMERELSKKYLRKSNSGLTMSHNELKGDIVDTGIIVDGILLYWDDVCRILASYNGAQLNLVISDPAA